MYGVAGVVVTGTSTSAVLAFTGAGTMLMVIVAVGMIVSGLLLLRFAALSKTK